MRASFLQGRGMPNIVSLVTSERDALRMLYNFSLTVIFNSSLTTEQEG